MLFALALRKPAHMFSSPQNYSDNVYKSSMKFTDANNENLYKFYNCIYMYIVHRNIFRVCVCVCTVYMQKSTHRSKPVICDGRPAEEENGCGRRDTHIYSTRLRRYSKDTRSCT